VFNNEDFWCAFFFVFCGYFIFLCVHFLHFLHFLLPPIVEVDISNIAIISVIPDMVKTILSGITNTPQKTYRIAQETDSWNRLHSLQIKDIIITTSRRTLTRAAPERRPPPTAACVASSHQLQPPREMGHHRRRTAVPRHAAGGGPRNRPPPPSALPPQPPTTRPLPTTTGCRADAPSSATGPSTT